MKRRFIEVTALVLTAVLFFTGCLAKDVTDMAGDYMESLKSSKSENTSEQEKYIDSGDYAREFLSEIIECFKNRDKERLKKFFCMSTLIR